MDINTSEELPWTLPACRACFVAYLILPGISLPVFLDFDFCLTSFLFFCSLIQFAFLTSIWTLVWRVRIVCSSGCPLVLDLRQHLFLCDLQIYGINLAASFTPHLGFGVNLTRRPSVSYWNMRRGVTSYKQEEQHEQKHPERCLSPRDDRLLYHQAKKPHTGQTDWSLPPTWTGNKLGGGNNLRPKASLKTFSGYNKREN